MAFGNSKKPKNQGSAGTAHVAPPLSSSKPSKGGEAPTTTQDHRGFHTPGKGGSGSKAGPKKFR